MKASTNKTRSIDLNAAKKENQRRIAHVKAKADKLLSDMDDLMQNTSKKSLK